MKDAYTQEELNKLVAATSLRSGWDFSRMHTLRQPVPWDYIEEVKRYLQPTHSILDVGTGGGERFAQLASRFARGVGVDIDPAMIETAKRKSTAPNVTFTVADEKLEGLAEKFDMVINRHAPFDLAAVDQHLQPGGYFITQQVGEKNMLNVKTILGAQTTKAPISKEQVLASNMRLVAFMEYDVEYVVQDIESLVFWLSALDMLHADVAGAVALQDAEKLNAILKENVDSSGFVTNEHRYLVIAQKADSPPQY